MHSTVGLVNGDRKALRRAVSVPCELACELFDDSIELAFSDLSPFGAYVDSPIVLEAGTEVLVAFTPPRASELRVFRATVARAGLFRRESDLHASGFGLEFLDVDADDRRALADTLVGIPPRVPPVSVRATSKLAFCEVLDDRTNHFEIEETLEIDGEMLAFAAESGFVTSARSAYVFAS